MCYTIPCMLTTKMQITCYRYFFFHMTILTYAPIFI
uniref:Uncharacterized protein n=1 Tax=Arundo donax TaxID=35708 RepID=A0A0A9GS72_ARUDO